MTLVVVVLVPVRNVTSCFLIDLCDLCGAPPGRGKCNPETGLSKCTCYENIKDPSRPYQGDLCYEPEAPLAVPPALPSRWTPVVVGILAGLAGLFCAVTCCLLAVAAWRNRKRPP